tara:strand:+ start:1270 stop:1410 length:141 start_codon:yes stop_codon:yes gene_type:complete
MRRWESGERNGERWCEMRGKRRKIEKAREEKVGPERTEKLFTLFST